MMKAINWQLYLVDCSLLLHTFKLASVVGIVFYIGVIKYYYYTASDTPLCYNTNNNVGPTHVYIDT